MVKESPSLHVSELTATAGPIIQNVTNQVPRQNVAPRKAVTQGSGEWSRTYGPYYTTNKAVWTALEVVTNTVGGYNVLFGNQALGTALWLSSGAISIGSRSYKTVYIKYTQQFSRTKPGLVKEVRRYYKHSNHTGYITTKTHYFNTIRPY